MLKSDSALPNFISAMLSRDTVKALRLLGASPKLATASFRAGATQKASNDYLLREIPHLCGRYGFAYCGCLSHRTGAGAASAWG
jgi:hypothetical protein